MLFITENKIKLMSPVQLEGYKNNLDNPLKNMIWLKTRWQHIDLIQIKLG